MTDPDLVLKKLALIDTCLRALRTRARPQDLEDDFEHRAFVERTLQVAIQAAIDAGAHVVSDENLGEPATSRELFTLLARAGWIGAPLARSLERMVGFRNVLVHGYDAIDLEIVRRALQEGLGDLETFVGAMRARL
ncbi:MAG: DUF86 domain-containing protein [Planctomycetes bacterium]|nr:DUF86 domain-containing protein [Planctomycetota bacterium]